MKKSIVFCVLLVCFLAPVFCGGTTENNESRELIVYAYDSFCGEWGPGNGIAQAFEEKTGIRIRYVELDSAVEVYSKIVFEGSACPADVAIGMSDTMKTDASLFTSWTPDCQEDLIPYDRASRLVPFDYGIFSFIIDTQSNGAPVPTCLEDLTKDIYKNKIILIDPRTSSVGLGLLDWTVSAMGVDEAFSWWSRVKKNVLTVGSSWSSAYGLFTEHEAPLVISYTTSPVYHYMYEDTERYRAVEFSDGHLQTLEFLGILESSDMKEEAKAFCNFILTEGQADIAVANTMFPANTKTVLPEAFDKAALKPSKVITPSDRTIRQELLDRWATVMTSK